MPDLKLLFEPNCGFHDLEATGMFCIGGMAAACSAGQLSAICVLAASSGQNIVVGATQHNAAQKHFMQTLSIIAKSLIM